MKNEFTFNISSSIEFLVAGVILTLGMLCRFKFGRAKPSTGNIRKEV